MEKFSFGLISVFLFLCLMNSYFATLGRLSASLHANYSKVVNRDCRFGKTGKVIFSLMVLSFPLHRWKIT